MRRTTLILVILVVLIVIGIVAYGVYTAIDWDMDGLPTIDEFTYGTNPRKADTDGDGINDGDEINLYKTNPLKPDTDGDGLTDLEEVTIYLTDPLKIDTDGDKLNDSTEALIYHTNPRSYDTDNDNITDYDEIMLYDTNPLTNDTDHDGLNDYVELKTYHTDPRKNDTDEDGLLDLEEIKIGTDPSKKDTDEDGYIDSEDLFPLFNVGINLTIANWTELFPADGFFGYGDPYFIVKIEYKIGNKFYEINATLIGGVDIDSAINLTYYVFDIPDSVDKVYITVYAYDNDTMDGAPSDQLYDLVTDPENSPIPYYILSFTYELAKPDAELNKMIITSDGSGDQPDPDHPDASITVSIESVKI